MRLLSAFCETPLKSRHTVLFEVGRVLVEYFCVHAVFSISLAGLAGYLMNNAM